MSDSENDDIWRMDETQDLPPTESEVTSTGVSGGSGLDRRKFLELAGGFGAAGVLAGALGPKLWESFFHSPVKSASQLKSAFR